MSNLAFQIVRVLALLRHTRTIRPAAVLPIGSRCAVALTVLIASVPENFNDSHLELTLSVRLTSIIGPIVTPRILVMFI